MSKIAKLNGDDVHANVVACDKSLRGRTFECQCEKCGAQLILKEGEKIKPYFAAIPSAPHMKGCFYGSDLLIDPDECTVPASILNALRTFLAGKSISRRGVGDGMGTDSNSTGKMRLSTLSLMFRFLKSSLLSKIVGGMRVREVLIDDRSVKYYFERDVRGVHIVEGYLQDDFFLRFEGAVYRFAGKWLC